jgi:hypothetical protein
VAGLSAFDGQLVSQTVTFASISSWPKALATEIRWCPSRARAEHLLSELASRLPREILTLAQARAAGVELDTIAAQVLEEL